MADVTAAFCWLGQPRDWPHDPAANERRDPYLARAMRTVFGPMTSDARAALEAAEDDDESDQWPEDAERDRLWDEKQARAEERARYREEMGE